MISKSTSVIVSLLSCHSLGFGHLFTGAFVGLCWMCLN
uniref:Uncharacterized protein n=1 Tax=Rhizophora mucronata TaxID=61149 RepID=A0A2P2IXQ9_RHIMU